MGVISYPLASFPPFCCIIFSFRQEVLCRAEGEALFVVDYECPEMSHVQLRRGVSRLLYG